MGIGLSEFPRRLQITKKMLGVEIIFAEFDREVKVLVIRPVRSGGNLVVTSVFEGEIKLYMRRFFWIKLFAIVPVAHYDRLRRPFEKIGMIPTIVSPNPRTRSIFLTLFDEEEEIVLPKLFLANDDIIKRLLMNVGLLVLT